MIAPLYTCFGQSGDRHAHEAVEAERRRLLAELEESRAAQALWEHRWDAGAKRLAAMSPVSVAYGRL